MRIGLELRPVGEMKKREKRKNKSHKTMIFHHCVAAPPVNRSQPNFDVFVGLSNFITYSKNGSKISIGFSRPTGGKTHISLQKANGLNNIAMRYRAGL